MALRELPKGDPVNATIQQKCPRCPEMLTFAVIAHSPARAVDGSAQFTIEAQTTPESTAHVWTHAPKEQ